MSDLTSHIYDLYEDYKLLCNKFKTVPIDIMDDWYTHFRILEKSDELIHKENE